MEIKDCQLVEVTQTEINILEGLWIHSTVLLCCHVSYYFFFLINSAGTSVLLDASGQCIFHTLFHERLFTCYVGYMDMAV